MPNQTRQIGIASAIWAGSIFLSRIIGLVREMVLGRTLGAGIQADLYTASFTLPDFLNYLVAAGALSIVFIPIFGGYLARNEREHGWTAFSHIANFILLLGGLGVGVLMLFARQLAEIVGPGFQPEQMEILTRLTRIILPAQLFHIVGGLLSATLQAQDRHFLPALAPLVYSACIILGGVIGAPYIGAEGFAWGVLVGSALGPFGLPLYGCWKSQLHWKPVLSFTHPDLRRYLWLSLPIMLGFSIVAVDEWILRNQASYLGEGAVAYLQYARTLMKVPIGVFGMAAGVAAYPTISRLIGAGQPGEAYALLARAVRLLLVPVLAAQVCLTVASFESVYIIWGMNSSRFTVQDAQATAACLTFLCLGLAGWAVQTVISRGFYALGNTWQPTLVGTAIAVAAIPLYIYLRIRNQTIGLALASSLAILAYVLILGALQRRRFQRELPGTPLPEMLGTALRLLAATAAGSGLGLVLRPAVVNLLPGLDLWSILGRTGLLCLTGMTAFLLVAHLLKVRELQEMGGMIGRRLLRRRQSPAGRIS